MATDATGRRAGEAFAGRLAANPDWLAAVERVAGAWRSFVQSDEFRALMDQARAEFEQRMAPVARAIEAARTDSSRRFFFGG